MLFYPIEFSNSFLLPLLEKLNKQGKLFILLGDFNLNLLNHNIDYNVASFIDILENYLMPCLLYTSPSPRDRG